MSYSDLDPQRQQMAYVQDLGRRISNRYSRMTAQEVRPLERPRSSLTSRKWEIWNERTRAPLVVVREECMAMHGVSKEYA